MGHCVLIAPCVHKADMVSLSQSLQYSGRGRLYVFDLDPNMSVNTHYKRQMIKQMTMQYYSVRTEQTGENFSVIDHGQWLYECIRKLV